MPPGNERIVVLALQRLGDVLTAARITDALARRRTTAVVEVVHWDATAQAAALLPGVGRRHALPFNSLRRGARAHTIAPLRRLDHEITAILAHGGFDRVINLTSTRFASWLAPALLAEGGALTGPSIDPLGRYVASHPSIAYLDDWGVDPERNTFAHQDLYARAVGVRLGGWAGLRSSGGKRTGPVVVHPFGSERAKDWRTPDDWRGLLGRLHATFGRPCVLVGGPRDAEALAHIARGTAATISTAPLSGCLGLLEHAIGLVSVDTVAIHLAAMVECPSVVLRRGPARGLAFVAAASTLCIDAADDMPTVDEVVAFAERQFTETPVPLAFDPSRHTRLRVREGFRDDYGYLGLRSPAWCRGAASVDVDDESDRLWRSVWRSEFDREAPSPALIDALCRGGGRFDLPRWNALLGSSSAVGNAARACSRNLRSAA